MVRHRTVEVAGIRIFYREAGSQDAPAVLLLHGFPSSSHQFRFLLLALADRYHVLAPDFPGFGFSACPNTAEYAYTFTHYTDTIEAFTRKFELDRYALYVHDYEAQVGFRLALRSPDRIKALVIQNSEALRMAALRPSQQWRTSGVILRLKSEKYCDENSLQKKVFAASSSSNCHQRRLSLLIRERFRWPGHRSAVQASSTLYSIYISTIGPMLLFTQNSTHIFDNTIRPP